MSRDTLSARSPLTKEERWQLFKGYLAVCRWTDVYFAWRPNLPDEADNHLIELAVGGGAAAIVSRDLRHLTGGELRFPQIQMLGPEQCLEVFP